MSTAPLPEPAPRPSPKPALPRHMQAPPELVHGWFAPLRSQEVAADRPTSFTYMGRELVAFRDEAGKVRVLDAACPHFGAHLGHGGAVIEGKLRCPYHKLDFDGSGRCAGAAAHYDPSRVRHLRTRSWDCREAYGMIWVWFGPNPAKADRELALDRLDWEGWTTPITNDGLELKVATPLWLAENIADLAHLRTVHCWDLEQVVEAPGEREDGSFGVTVDVRWRLGARLRDPRFHVLGNWVNSAFRLSVRAMDAGMVVAEAQLTPEQGNIRLRNIVLIHPLGNGKARLRVMVAVRRQWEGLPSKMARALTGAGFEELLDPLFLAIGVSDFQSDALVWERRVHLENPVPLAGEGAFIEFRKWSTRFWPEESGVEPRAERPRASPGKRAA